MLPETFSPGFLRQLEILRIRARRAFLGTRQGGHVSIRKGHGIEFSDFRKYELGDNPRHIDWGVYARSDRLFVKRFQEEEDLSVLIIVDGSASMIATPSDKKWDRARDMSLALAYMALIEQDTVVFNVPGVLEPANFTGAKAIHVLGGRVSKATPGGNPDLVKEMRKCASRIRFPGKAIVISDFMMPGGDLEKIFQPLRAKNLDISAIQIIGRTDEEPFANLNHPAVRDSETGEIVMLSKDPESEAAYAELFEAHSRKVEDVMRGSQIQFARMRAEEDLLEFLINNLTGIGLLRRS
jgi:uncharacterized protein (DUF58 family)